jgi:hypothetical protein
MTLNSKITEYVIHAAGVGCLSVDKREAAAYDADPDGWVADYLGLTIAEYYEFVDRDGIAMCGATTKAGRPCRNHVTGHPWRLEADQWRALHRKELCATHGNPSATAQARRANAAK